MINAGRNTANPKISKAIGGLPYTNVFVISGRFEADSTDYKLCTTVDALKDLPHAQLTTASKVKVASTSNDDTVSGTGARVVVIAGLINYELAEEVLFMNGQTPVETVNEFNKVLEITALQIGSNTDSVTGDLAPVGDIYCGTGTFTAGIPANPICGIDSAYSEIGSREGIFTIPDGKLGFVRDYYVALDASSTANPAIKFLLALKIFGFPDNFWFKFAENYINRTYNYIPEFIVPIPPKTDLQIRVARTNAQTKTGTFNLTLELQDIRGAI